MLELINLVPYYMPFYKHIFGEKIIFMKKINKSTKYIILGIIALMLMFVFAFIAPKNANAQFDDWGYSYGDYGYGYDDYGYGYDDYGYGYNDYGYDYGYDYNNYDYGYDYGNNNNYAYNYGYDYGCTNCGYNYGGYSYSHPVYNNPVVQNPTVSIYASPSSVSYNGSTTISWSSNNATSCNASGGTNGWAGGKSTSGTFYAGALTTPTTFYINCSNSAGSADASTTVGVAQQVQNPTVSIYASPSSVSYNGASTITWNSSNATTCYASGGANGWNGDRSISGTFYTGSLTGSTTFYINCTNSTGSANSSVTVSVDNYYNYNNNYNYNYSYTSPASVSISADRTSVSYNESTTIRWYPNNATYCYGSNGSNSWAGVKGSTNANSFNTGPLPATTIYTITCSNNIGGSESKSVTVYVGNQTIVSNRPTVVVFTDQTSVSHNGTSTIRWITTNATSCYASGGSTGWEGVKNIGPGSFYTGSLTSSKTYTMTCRNNFGSATDSQTITVRGETVTNPTPATASLVLVTSSVDRNQPIISSIDNTRPHPGDEINYTIGYQNIGTASITSLAMRIDLPSEVEFISSNPNNPTMSGQTLVFNLGTLKANGQDAVTVKVKVRDNTPLGINLYFPATLSYVSAGQSQSVNSNVSAQVWSGEEATDGNVSLGANVFGAGFLPTNLFGWLLLIILMLLLLLLVKYLLDTGAFAFQGQNTIIADQHSSRKSTNKIE